MSIVNIFSVRLKQAMKGTVFIIMICVRVILNGPLIARVKVVAVFMEINSLALGLILVIGQYDLNSF